VSFGEVSRIFSKIFSIVKQALKRVSAWPGKNFFLDKTQFTGIIRANGNAARFRLETSVQIEVFFS